MNVPPLPRPTGGRFFEAYTQGPHDGGPRAAVHARRAGGVPLLLAQHRLRRAEEAAVAPADARARPAAVPGVHAQADAGAPRALRHRAGRQPRSGWSSCFRAFTCSSFRTRRSRPARCGCSTGFLLVNLLVLLEVADRLSLKNDLEIAREIQQAMLPRAAFQRAGRRSVRHDPARPTPSAATSTTSCRSPTAACCWRSATSPARAARRRC